MNRKLHLVTIAGLAVGLASGADATCVNFGTSSEIETEFEYWFDSDDDITGVTGIVFATATHNNITFHNDPAIGITTCFAMDSALIDVAISMMAGTAAVSCGHDTSGQLSQASAEVKQHPTVNNPNRIETKSESGLESVCPSPPITQGYNQNRYGSASAGFDVEYEFNGDVTANYSGLVTVKNDLTVTDEPPQFIIIGENLSEKTITIWGDAYVADGITVTEDTSVPGEVTFTATYSGSTTNASGTIAVDGNALVVTDDAYDLDGDGRFSCSDVAFLQNFVNTSTMPDDYDADLDFLDDWSKPNPENDQADVDFLQSLIDAGAGSGLAGDGNGDCSVTCADYGLVVSAFGSVFGDAQYTIALDTDLDKDIDSDDVDYVLANLTGSCDPADFNGDGCVDGADLGLLLLAWGACSGCPQDLTGDGNVDGADLGILLTAWGC
ncbi:MAG: hypothetical protein ACF8GE_09655 [Phycisphaerales bacterium JB043]